MEYELRQALSAYVEAAIDTLQGMEITDPEQILEAIMEDLREEVINTIEMNL